MIATHAYEIGLVAATVTLALTAMIALWFRGGAAKEYAKPIVLSQAERSFLETTIDVKKRHKAQLALAARPETDKMRRRAARVARESETAAEQASTGSPEPPKGDLPATPA